MTFSSDAESDPTSDALATLATFDGEIEATLVAQELNAQGVLAQASGTLTAGFRAEAPGRVKVLVHQENLEQAKAILDDYFASRQDIDWDHIDVGERPDGSA